MDSNDPSDVKTNESSPAILPKVAERFPANFCDGPHPATIPVDQLLQQCELRTQSRSGPGGQHRNRTSSGAFLHHLPSGIVGEATERRSQAQNRDVVMQRLRFRLAVWLRTTSILDQQGDDTESSVRSRYEGHAMRLNEQNQDKPAVLALVLNDLHASGGQPSLVTQSWRVGTSRLVTLIKSHPPAFTLVNQIRQHHGRRPLR